MCGRYFIGDSQGEDELLEIIDSMNRYNGTDKVKTSGEIFPTDTVPVIANNRSMVRSVFAMTWGYSLPDGRKIINARSESADAKPMFRDGMAQRRCVVPATNYFEWEKSGKDKTKYAIRPNAGGLMYMAGIYRMENSCPVFTILTREPAENITFIHNRMPVLFPAEMVSDWIDPKYDARDILKEAITGVQYRRAEPLVPQQIGMSFS